jgi:uncharacterized Zn-binding protein involved in type VI secretion
MASALVSGDIAGGAIIASQQWMSIDGVPVVVVGSVVLAHGFHLENEMAVGSGWAAIDGAAICRQGDAAQCGDLGIASKNWFDCA